MWRRQDKTVLSVSNPVSNLQLLSLKYMEDYWKLGNWKLGRDETNSSKLGRYKTKLSCFVCSCIHTADADKTRQSCLVRVGGVNKLLAHTVQILYGIRRQLTTGACIISVSLQETGSQVSWSTGKRSIQQANNSVYIHAVVHEASQIDAWKPLDLLNLLQLTCHGRCNWTLYVKPRSASTLSSAAVGV